MVTHDVDEALLLSDRIVLLTNGPESYIDPRRTFSPSRDRMEVKPSQLPARVRLFISSISRNELEAKAKQALAIARNGLEKVNLEIGFVPLTDCAPQLPRKACSRNTEGVILSATELEERQPGVAGDWTQPDDSRHHSHDLGMDGGTPIVTALVMARNGNAITLSKDLYNAGYEHQLTLKH